MLENIIRWSIKNRILVVLMTVMLGVLGLKATLSTPIDALPDLSDPQVIVYTTASGLSPRTVEDQITYPLTTSLVSVSGAKTVRGYSFFGYSLVYIIFDEGTDLYWARARVQEYLNQAKAKLPEKAVPQLGPDASGLGWVYEYALVSKTRSLAELRSLQDWYMKYGLATVPGVSEVASIGGYVKQIQVRVNPEKLRAFKISLSMIDMALQRSNEDAGGEVIEQGETEFMIRGEGYIKTLDDVRGIPLMAANGTPVRLGDVADVDWGPEMRRGLSELDGKGEVVGGIVIMRYGQNALDVIKNTKEKLEQLKQGLPPDVEIVPTYDRTGIIERAVENLSHKLLEEMIIVAIVCAVFLMHGRSAFVAVLTLPIALLISFLVMRMQGINANIMSLGGLAIAIGAMVDAAIIMIENAHKHLEHEQEKPELERRPHWQIIQEAASEVGPSLFWSLLVITISFVPVFSLEAQEGRLFKPLAYTKTYSMAAAAFLSITLVPVLMGWFIRGKIPSEDRNPINRFLVRLYHPVVKFVLARPWGMIMGALLVVAVTIVPFRKLGSEFMPALYEGDILYMPTVLPGISITKAKELTQRTDKLIASLPEVARVFGKAGRAETATDPAGLDMLETVVQLKPEEQWRPGMTHEKIVAALDSMVRIPGLTNAWTMPIKARIDMLSTGIKTPVGIKISGPNLDTLQRIGQDLETIVRGVPGTASAFAERAVGGNYLNIKIDRDAAAKLGITVADIQDVVRTGMAGMPVTTTVLGLERYTISLRYHREAREDTTTLGGLLVSAPGGAQIPLRELVAFSFAKAPMVIRTESTKPNAWVFVDTRESDIGGYITHAQEAVKAGLTVPQGYTVVWSGEFESMERAKKTLLFVIPITLLLIITIIFLNTKSLAKTSIVLLAVPFSLVGAVWFLWFLDYNLSVAVWVGLIALAGLDAETGVIMLLYLDQSFDSMKKNGRMTTLDHLREAIDHGAVKRVRPKVMTATVILAGLMPILWSHGAGSDVMKRIASPMVGGVVTSVAMELLVYPAIYFVWRKRHVKSSNPALED